MRLMLLSIALLGGASLAAAIGPPAQPPDTSATAGRVSSADGVPIAYESHGQGSPALVFIHGWSCNRGFWKGQVEAFAPRYRVVTLDLAGHGESGTDRKGWTLPACGQDVKAVVDALGLRRVILVGHSMGGSVALEVARLLPGTVIAVIGVDTLHNAEFRLPPAQVKEFLASFDEGFREPCGAFVRSMFPKDAEAPLVAHVEREMCGARPEIALELLRQGFAYDAASAMRTAGVPIRCINADTYPTAVEINRKYADFDVVVMHGVGHFLHLERPAEFNDNLARLIVSLTLR